MWSKKRVGEETVVDILLYDDLEITQYSERKFCIEREGKTLKYALFGTVDIVNAALKSVVNFEIDKEELFDYGYLNGEQVKIEVLRINFDFKEK